jgi:hypothetical protein
MLGSLIYYLDIISLICVHMQNNIKYTEMRIAAWIFPAMMHAGRKQGRYIIL